MPYYNDYEENRVLSREVDAFMGIARMLSAKPDLEEADVRFLATWLEENRRVMDQPLIRPIADNIKSGLLSPQRRMLIHSQLRALSGDVDGDGVVEGPTSILFKDPEPIIYFSKRRFCFTGTFDFGQRWECEEEVEKRGGTHGPIAQSTDYLVIGAHITDSWKHSTFGDKINKARGWQSAGLSDVKIVSEVHWVKSLENPASDNDPGPSVEPREPTDGRDRESPVTWNWSFGGKSWKS
jgi:NAD-dependent DNA ligase